MSETDIHRDDTRHDPQYEPSYYEIALTHRQVLFGFVILLGCLMATFFAGVWMGRGGETAQAATVVPVEEGTEVADSSLPQVNFFSEEEGGSGQAPPAPAQAVEPAAAGAQATADGRTPVQLSEEARKRRRERIRQRRLAEEQAAAAQKADAEPEPVAVTPQETPKPAPPKPAASKPAQSEPKAPSPQPGSETAAREPKPVAPTAGTADRFVIQVLSTRDRDKANDVVARLQAGGYRTSMSTVEQGEQVMYRVRVGPYGNRADADSAADTVRRTFKLDTWVTAE